MDSNSLILFFDQHQARRIRVIENILIGRKTVSNLFWGMRYNILSYLGIFNQMNLAEDHDHLKQLLEMHLLKLTSDHQYLMTDLGKIESQKIKQSYYYPKNLNINLEYDVKRFRARFLLAVQIISEFSFKNVKYYPLQINFEDEKFIKNWFHFNKKHHLIVRIKTFLNQSLNKLTTPAAWQIASTLIGHGIAGDTIMQQSSILKKAPFEIELMDFDIFCQLIKLILNFKDPVLMQLLSGLKKSMISNSALKTFQIANKYSMKMVGNIQRIKKSTIEEHLLEVAIFKPLNQFPFNHFLTSKILSKLNQTYSGNVDSWKYQEISNTSIDFFHFRLYQIFRSK